MSKDQWIHARSGLNHALDDRIILAGHVKKLIQQWQDLYAQGLFCRCGEQRRCERLGCEIRTPAANLHIGIGSDEGEDTRDDDTIVGGIGEDDLPRSFELLYHGPGGVSHDRD